VETFLLIKEIEPLPQTKICLALYLCNLTL